MLTPPTINHPVTIGIRRLSTYTEVTREESTPLAAYQLGCAKGRYDLQVHRSTNPGRPYYILETFTGPILKSGYYNHGTTWRQHDEPGTPGFIHRRVYGYEVLDKPEYELTAEGRALIESLGYNV